MEPAVVYKKVSTPLGSMFLAASIEGVVCASFASDALKNLRAKLGKGKRLENAATIESNPANREFSATLKVLRGAEKEFTQYFTGDLNALDSLDLAPLGTPFQKKVWRKLRAVPGGKLTSYGQLAKAAGSPQAMRAAGAACRANPIILAIPCHRAIGKNRALTGFNAGLPRKIALLRHEGFALEPAGSGGAAATKVK